MTMVRKTIDYLDAAKEKLGLQSDYAFAKQLELTTAGISQYRTGKRVIDDYTACRIADVLEIDPMEVIAAANAEREKNEDRKSYWAKKWEAITATIAAAVFALGVLAGGNFENQPVKRVFKKLWAHLPLLR